MRVDYSQLPHSLRTAQLVPMLPRTTQKGSPPLSSLQQSAGPPQAKTRPQPALSMPQNKGVRTLLRLPGGFRISASGAFGFGYVTATGRERVRLFFSSFPLSSISYNIPPGKSLRLCFYFNSISVILHNMAARLPLARLSAQRLTTLSRSTRATSRFRGVQSLSTSTRSNVSSRASGLLQASSG